MYTEAERYHPVPLTTLAPNSARSPEYTEMTSKLTISLSIVLYLMKWLNEFLYLEPDLLYENSRKLYKTFWLENILWEWLLWWFIKFRTACYVSNFVHDRNKPYNNSREHIFDAMDG